ncbi:MAG: hypothetical protein ACI883_000979, partial [Candidatus Azotimanducaceae bacterium]
TGIRTINCETKGRKITNSCLVLEISWRAFATHTFER